MNDFILNVVFAIMAKMALISIDVIFIFYRLKEKIELTLKIHA